MRIMDINADTVFLPSDFTNGRYLGVSCFNRKNQTPMVVMMSKSSNPPHWMIMDGTNQLFFLNRSDAVSYCKRKGYANYT